MVLSSGRPVRVAPSPVSVRIMVQCAASSAAIYLGIEVLVCGRDPGIADAGG